jgi:Holliday junction DNA helicase RuvA
MYSFITGIIEEKNENELVINNNGIGYELLVSNQTLTSVGAVGDKAKVYTYLYVRQDIFLLFGFTSREEKNMFLDLITVSGVGAKMAIGILSGMSAKNLIAAIATSDVVALSSLKGVGKKTAERIILELKGKIGNVNLTALYNESLAEQVDNFTEAINLLVSMGLTRLDAQNLVKSISLPTDTTEQIIEKALRNMK